MTIGCLILNYNDSETIENLLNKIKNYNIIDHIIVVDNKSSDNSYEQLLKHVGLKLQSYWQIEMDEMDTETFMELIMHIKI